MNFLYDLTATQPTPDSKFHGAGTYAEIVFFALVKKMPLSNIKMFAAYDSKRYINYDIIDVAKKNGVQIIDIKTETPRDIFEKYKITRFYSALLDEFIAWNFDDCQVITTVHGLRGLELPLEKIALKYCKNFKELAKTFLKLTFFYNRQFKKIYNGYKRFFDGKKKIITVSQHSKASILSFFPNMKEADIQVFSSPTLDQIKENYTPPADFSKIASEYGIHEKKYFLITSSARWLKNAMRAVFAFDSIFDDGRLNDFKIVLTGVNDKRIFEKQIIHKEKFVLLEFVERSELESLNKNAYAFIYPSLNEGFGYPPLEAMKYGVPVAASGTSSIPEVCTEAALYFDPYNASEIKNRVLQLCDLKIYNEFSKKAKLQYQKVSEMQKKDLDDLIEYLITPPPTSDIS